eukprot:448551-Pyramimonas_sp.AAC.1
MDSSPGRQTMRGTHGALLLGNLDFTVVGNWRAGRNIFIPHVLYTYTAFSVSKCRGPRASTPTEQP